MPSLQGNDRGPSASFEVCALVIMQVSEPKLTRERGNPRCARMCASACWAVIVLGLMSESCFESNEQKIGSPVCGVGVSSPDKMAGNVSISRLFPSEKRVS